MNQAYGTILVVATLGWIALTPGTIGAAGREETTAGRMSDVVRVEHGADLVTVRGGTVPLRDLVAALERRTSVRFRLAHPAFGDRAVTAHVDGQPLEQALRTMLRGFSYVIDHEPGRTVVLVASLAGDRELPASGPAAEAAGPLETPVAARLRQILPDLESPLADQREEALGELVGMSDGRATAALVDETRADRLVARVEAVHRLWRHAASLGFADVASIGALEELRWDPDETVATVARSALDDMRAFRRSTQGP